MLDLFNFLTGGIRGDVIGTDEVNHHDITILVDTCFTLDTGYYETAVRVDNDDFIIVEEYDNSTQAMEGHKFWKDYCAQSNLNFVSIQTGREYYYQF